MLIAHIGPELPKLPIVGEESVGDARVSDDAGAGADLSGSCALGTPSREMLIVGLLLIPMLLLLIRLGKRRRGRRARGHGGGR